MNTISKYANYLSSAIFGSTLVFIFTVDMAKVDKWLFSLLLFIVWFFPLVRIAYLSSRKEGSGSASNVEKLNKK